MFPILAHNSPMLALVLALQPALNYGLSAAQIDAKGMDGWIAFCEQREGHALPEYELRAQYFQYAEAVKSTNKVRIAKQPEGLRSYYNALGTELEAYATKLVAVEEAVAGGGTLYLLVYSGSQARSAEIVRSLTNGKFRAKRPYVTSEVSKLLGNLEQVVRAADPEFGKPKEAKAALTLARSAYGRITKPLSTRPRAESDFVLEFCASRAKFQMSE